MLVEQITPRAAHSWMGQKSENPVLQAILEKGFWIDKITGELIHCSLYGPSEIDYFGDLPRIAMIKHDTNRTYVVFNISKS